MIKARLRRCLPPMVASLLVMGVYSQSRLPSLSQPDSRALAARFQFEQYRLPEVTGYVTQTVRGVHPSLQRISAWISAVGSSVALGDIDGDGLANDFCLVDPRTDKVEVGPVPTRIPTRYKPFVIEPLGLRYDPATMAPMGCLIEDLNEDGRMDILVYYWGRTPIAFLRTDEPEHGDLGAADFKPVEIVPGAQRWYTNAMTTADLDGDGHPDLIIGNYFPDNAAILQSNGSGSEEMQNTMSRSSNGGRKHFLLWSGGTSGSEPTVEYREVTPEFSEDVSRGWALAVGAADIDGDLLPELYFANDFGPDNLLYNESLPGHLRFKVLKGRGGFAVPKSFVLGQDSFKGMGVDFGDLNANGRLDIFVSNITSVWGLMESNFLWLNTGETDSMQSGKAPYVQASDDFGLSRSGWSWDTKLADFDNDGQLEIVQATGFIKGASNGWASLQSLATANNEILRHPQFWPRFQVGVDLSGHEHLAFFARGRGGRYFNVSDEIGLGAASVTRGIAVADVDDDSSAGALSFAAADQWGDSFFFHNESPQRGAFLELYLLRALTGGDSGSLVIHAGHPTTETPGSPAIGAQAKVYLGDRCRVAQVDGGNGHSGRRSPEVHFGLGHLPTNSEPFKVDILWRGRTGRLHKKTVFLKPGRHTILLG